jgi:hypothetical protein
MVSTAIGRIFKRKDGKFLVYLPKKLAEDTAFPFQVHSSDKVEIAFSPGKDELIIRKIK